VEPIDPARFTALRRLAADESRRFVVSLGGGGVPALCGNTALVELLETLDLRGRVAEIWGTSAGAIVGGAWASGTKAARILEILRSLRARGVTDVNWGRFARALFLRPFGASLPDALLHGRRCHQALVESLSVDTFEACEIPFRCIACTDDKHGTRRIFREGPLAPAISASMSLPGILLPRDETGRPCHGFLDGGLVEKTPLYSPMADHLRLGDGRELVILGTYFGLQTNYHAKSHGFIDRFMVTIDALADQLWEHQELAARKQPGVTVMLLNARLDPSTIQFDLTRIDHNVDRAHAVFADQLQDAKIALTIGTSCEPSTACLG
jgi:hypothetical protein